MRRITISRSSGRVVIHENGVAKESKKARKGDTLKELRRKLREEGLDDG